MHAVEHYGDRHAPLMLFLHGGGVGGWMWDRQVLHFTQYHCIVPELIQPEAGRFTIEASADRALEIIHKHAQGKPVTVIGFSLGAQILVNMLSMQPRGIDHAMINSAFVRGMPYAPLLLRSMRLAMPLVRNRTFAKLQAKSLYIRDDQFEEYFQLSRRTTWESLSAVMEANMAFRIPESFKDAQANILVTVGSEEKAMMHKSMHDLVKANANCKGYAWPNFGHGAPLAAPESFNRLLESWMAGGVLPDHVPTL